VRFIDVRLKTAELENLKRFYEEKLGIRVVDSGEKFFTLQIGESRLTFEELVEGRPFYHYAFNIPENRFQEAKEWLEDKVMLNQEEGKDEVDFVSWNAHSLYFEDPTGNIVEFIARHNLNNGSDQPFSASSLLCVSEIGIVEEDVLPLVDELIDQGFAKYQEGSEEFVPVGDEHGLLIVVKVNRRWFFGKQDAKIFPVTLHVEGHGMMVFGADQLFEGDT